MPGAAEVDRPTTCKPQACAIQTCLASNDYQEKKCIKEIAALIACCDSVEGEKPPQCSFSKQYRKYIDSAPNQAAGP
jgi:hypothetical protein